MFRKRRPTHKSTEWSSLQQNFSDLLQHEKTPMVIKLDESHLSQRIEDDDKTDSEQIDDLTIQHVFEDGSTNSQCIEDHDSVRLSPAKCHTIPSRIEISCHHDSVDLFSSPVPDIESKAYVCENVHPLKYKNLFSSPILENTTPKRQSGIFSDSLIRCCTPKRKIGDVIGNETPTSSKLCKSTPSGSPILKKSCQKLDRNHQHTLIPLSPITPGLDWSHFTSVFSVHANETSLVNQTDDQTTLATPLDVTDDQIDEFTQENQGDKNEAVEITENFKTQIPNSKPKNVLNTTGSNWIKNVQDKIEEDWQKRAAKFSENSSFLQDASLYDSGKKSKFVKGGFAEKLTKVLKKEQSQKSVFLQKLQTKKLRKQDSLLLKVLSDIKEGLLRIVQCKTVENDENSTKSLPYTMILPDGFADSLDLTLGLNLRIYQPYQTVNVESLDTTIILSAYNVITDGYMDEQSFKDSESSSLPLSQSQNFENLLNCLEAHTGCDESISIVATIQRIFCHFKAASEKWSILCIDAYGTIFLADSQNFSNSPSLIRLLSSGEGQRVVLKNIYLKDRMKRSQYPSLFSVIDSIWDSSGLGLLQCSASQSQQSGELFSLLPPSYCYFLSTDETSSVVFPGKDVDVACLKEDCVKRNCHIISDLNRVSGGNDQKCSYTDVLYCLPKIVTFAEISDEKCGKNQRFSIICRFVEFKNVVDCDSQDLYCSQHNDSDITLIVKECNSSMEVSKSERNVEVIAKNACLLPHAMTEDSILVFKDICVISDSLVADQFSRVKLIDCLCEGYHFLNLTQSDAES